MKYLLALLALVSSSALAITPGPQSEPTFDVLMASANQTGNSVQFNGLLVVRPQPPTILTFSSFIDFGDGGSAQSGALISSQHTYAPGSFSAVMTLAAIGTWEEFIYDARTDSLTSSTRPINYNFQQVFQIEVASHAPEPATYAMLLAGLALLIRRAGRARVSAP